MRAGQEFKIDIDNATVAPLNGRGVLTRGTLRYGIVEVDESSVNITFNVKRGETGEIQFTMSLGAIMPVPRSMWLELAVLAALIVAHWFRMSRYSMSGGCTPFAQGCMRGSRLVQKDVRFVGGETGRLGNALE